MLVNLGDSVVVVLNETFTQLLYDPAPNTVRMSADNEFDVLGLYAAMDAQRTQWGLSWRQIADEIWMQSVLLNRKRNDHSISPSTLTGMAKRYDTSCQRALFMLRWLGRTPESFFPNPPSNEGRLRRAATFIYSAQW